MHSDKLIQPMRWKKPRRIFVVSMGDLFHEDVPFEYIAAVFGVMAACPQHTFMLLTKRPRRMKRWMDLAVNAPHDLAPIRDTWPLPNVWLGVTAEDQQRADYRIPVLLSIPAAKRFVSCEPLLGPIDLREYLWCESCGYSKRDQEIHWDHHLCSPELKTLDWIVSGGETGPKARPMHPNWVRWLRDQCIGSRTHFFFKKWSGTQRNGRLLDDRTWDNMPDIERNP
jgi:protein gp37